MRPPLGAQISTGAAGRSRRGTNGPITANVSYLKRIAVMSLASLGLATAGLVIGAYSGGASGVTDGSPAVTASAPALNCTLPPPGVPAADWCPPGN